MEQNINHQSKGNQVAGSDKNNGSLFNAIDLFLKANISQGVNSELDMKSKDILSSELLAGKEALSKKQAVREITLAEQVVNNIIMEVRDITPYIIQAIMDKSSMRDIILLYSLEVVRASNGLLVVQEFHERDKSEQTVYVYVGTHWVKYDIQLFHDNLKQMAINMGMEEKYYTDELYMHKFYTRTLFMLKSKHSASLFATKTFINLMNGTLVIDDSGNATLQPHDPNDFIEYVLNYNYDTEAQCPMFEQYLNKVLPDSDVQKVVQQFAGYCFSRHLRLEKILMLCGKGSNGKSVLIDILTGLFGQRNVSSVMLSEFDNDQKLATMDGKMVNMSSETGKKFHPEIVKTLASGEPILVKVVYRKPYQMTTYGKLIASFNKLPSPEDTWAFFRRLLKIDFKVTISGQEQDKNLAQKICQQELSGVLNWALDGLRQLICNGDFTDSKVINDSIEEYKNQADTVVLFAACHCAKSDREETKGVDILAKYRQFCMQEEFPKWRVLGRTMFYERLSELYKRTKHQKMPYFSLTLTDYE